MFACLIRLCDRGAFEDRRSVFACLIRLCDRGAFEVSPAASFNLNVNESHLCAFKRYEVTVHRCCFVHASLVLDSWERSSG